MKKSIIVSLVAGLLMSGGVSAKLCNYTLTAPASLPDGYHYVTYVVGGIDSHFAGPLLAGQSVNLKNVKCNPYVIYATFSKDKKPIARNTYQCLTHAIFLKNNITFKSDKPVSVVHGKPISNGAQSATGWMKVSAC